jgi:hypothetical protein
MLFITFQYFQVADVVQNVQKVLKGELNKPVPVHSLSSSIPGNVNSQWTNMLPYILSGGLVDQQNIDEDASIILPTSDSDLSYANAVPLQNGKPTNIQYEPATSDVQIQPTSNKQDIKLTSHKPMISNNEKPIYLLGNMALNSDILEEQETYNLPTKNKTNRPTLTSIHKKFTSTEPTVLKNTVVNLKNSTNNNGTFYIPLSVSSSLQGNSQSPKNHSQLDIYKIPSFISNPNQKNFTTLPYNKTDTTTAGAVLKTTTAYIHLDEPLFTRVPIVHEPTILVEKVISSTHRTDQPKTPAFEQLSTLSSESISSTIKEELSDTKLNESHIDETKKSETMYKISTSHYTSYDLVTKPSSATSVSSPSLYYPIQTPMKLNNLNTISSTYRPAYESITKISTDKFIQPTHYSTYENITKPSIVKTISSPAHNLVHEGETKSDSSTVKSIFSQTIYGIDVPQITQPPVLEIATTKDAVNIQLNVTKYPTIIQETIIKTKEKTQALLPMKQQILVYEKNSNITLVSNNSDNSANDLLNTTEHDKINYSDDSKIPLYNDQVDTTISSFSSNINNNHNNVAYSNSTPKLKDKIASNSVINNVVYETDKHDVTTDYTTISIKSETNSKGPIINLNKNSNLPEIVNINSSIHEQVMATKEYNNNEKTIIDSDVKTFTQESKIRNNYDYGSIILQKDSTKPPETTIYSEIHNSLIEVTETVIPNFDTYSVNGSNIGEFKNQYESFSKQTSPNIETNTHSNVHKEANIVNTDNTNKSDNYQSWTHNEITTQFIPIDDGTTEYYEIKYNNNEIEKTISNTLKKQSTHMQESNDIFQLNNNTTDQSIIDPTIDYSTLRNKIGDLSYTNNFSEQLSSESETKNLTNNLVENNTSLYKYSAKISNNNITTPSYTNSNETKTTTHDKLSTENFIHENENTDYNLNMYSKPYSEVNNLIREQNKLSETVVAGNDDQAIISNLNPLFKPIDNLSTKSLMQLSTISPNIFTLKSNLDQFNSLNNGNLIPAKEKVNVITEELSVDDKNNKLSKLTTEIFNVFGNKPVTSQEDEVSTIKVIPIYDDYTSLYTLSPNDQNSLPPTTVSNMKSSENTENSLNITLMDLPLNNTMQLLKPIYQQQYKPIHQINYSLNSLVTTNPSKSNLTAQNTSVYNTILPNLRETFNNYMKEHYDLQSTTSANYNEVSHLQIFPTDIHNNSSNNTNEIPILTTLDHIKLDVPKYPTNQHELQLNTNLTTEISQYNSSESINESFSTVTYITENLGSFKKEQNLDSITKNTFLKETYSTEDINFQPLITKSSITKNKDNVAKPIIYLDLTNSDSNSDKQNISYQSNSNNLNASSFTRIQIKNPVINIEKILSEVTAQTNTPSSVHYTLNNYYKKYNNVDNEMIAGYSMYDQVQPTTEYVTDTTFYETAYGTSNPSTNNDSIYVTSNKNLINVSQKDKNVSYQEKPTTLLLKNDKNYIDKTSSIYIYTTEGEKDSTYNYESDILVPPESILMPSKANISSQIHEKSNSSIEKIHDLVNQRQDKPSLQDHIENEYSNNFTMTGIPFEKFETIIDEINSTPIDATTIITTIFDKINETSVELQNHTSIIKQTLPTSEPYQNSFETTDQYLATKKHNTIETSTQDNLRVKPDTGATTIVTIINQPITIKPYTTTTYSVTKGLFEKIQSTIDKSSGRINLEEEKNKVQTIISTELPKFTVKNKNYYTTDKRSTIEGYQSYTRKPVRPTNKGATFIKEFTTSKSIGVTKDNNVEKWTLVPQKNVNQTVEIKQSLINSKEGANQLNPEIISLDHATGAIGLDQSNKGLDKDVAEFLNMCNELSFKFWSLANSELNSSRSITLSPFGMISTLAMIFLGARGLTSNQMNDVLKLDDVVTFNPHLVFQNITDTVTLARGQGIQNAAFVRALFADRLKVRKIMPFYKEQAQQFYEGAVVDINFSTAGDILRRRTNLLIRKQTGGRIKDFVKTHTVPLRSPLTALSANIFQISCDNPDASFEGRDGEMYFAVSQTVKQRKLVPIPAVVWKSGVSAGYEPSLDATAVALGDAKRPVSLIMVMPGQQGLTAAGDNLERLEHRLFGNSNDNALEKLLKVIIPRRVDVQIPKFSHRSIVNITSALKKLGFDQLFAKTADLKGINGAGHDLYLADMLQVLKS